MARTEASRDNPAEGQAARRAVRFLAVCAVALGAANCAKAPQKLAGGAGGSDIDPKYGVRASKRLYNEGDAIPKGGGRRYSGKPYVVAGRTYVPREDARGYVREGLASWYGSAFHGRVTANGEVFDRHSIAAAHPTLPLPSYVRVTNLESGNSMVVRVNDRGPYHENRVMDVSEETARALDFHRRGTARVRVEYLGKASTAGSDDRKLLATLRTDGRPAAIGPRSAVMVADLGPDGGAPATERFARPARPALAFREPEETPEPPARRRPEPVLVAGRASVAVPSAIQPTAPSRRNPVALAEAGPAGAGARNAPLSLTPPPLKLASAGPERPTGNGRDAPAGTRQVREPARAAAAAPRGAMPDAAKLAMARLVAAAGPKPAGAERDAKAGKPAGSRDARTKAVALPEAKAPRRRIAGID